MGEEYRDGDLEAFFGCDPDFTGGLSTAEYMARIRGGADVKTDAERAALKAAEEYVAASERWKAETDPLLDSLPKAQSPEEAGGIADKINEILSTGDAEESRRAYKALTTAVAALRRARDGEGGEG